LVTKGIAKGKKPVVAAKYHSLLQIFDKRIVSGCPWWGDIGIIMLIGRICDSRCKKY
jgi:hypothetical protein